jgi:hypothetical protein
MPTCPPACLHCHDRCLTPGARLCTLILVKGKGQSYRRVALPLTLRSLCGAYGKGLRPLSNSYAQPST